MRVSLVVMVAGALTLFACDRKGEQANIVSETDNGVEVEDVPVDEGTAEEVTPPNTTEPERPDSIPASFRGKWTAVDQDCSDQASDMRLTVTAKELRFYESVGAVESIEKSGQSVTLTAAFTGEGDNWTRTQTLTLSDKGERLSIAGDGGTVVRKRCS